MAADPSITRSTRTYILATLLATLAATALIAMIVAILCPAQVTFMVTDASRAVSSADGTVSFHLSISANASQRRTKVKFESIFVDLFNTSSYHPLGREDAWRGRINARVDEMPHDYLEYPVNASLNVSAATPNRLPFPEFAPGNTIDEYGLTVKVMAQVHFKVGVVRTRLYGITVYCDRVVFPADRNGSKNICRPALTTALSSRPKITARDAGCPADQTSAFPVTCHS